MTFDEVLAQVLDLLQRERRLSYRAIKVRFGLDDDHEAQLHAGRPEEAYALAERTLTHARAHQERSNQAYALRLLGDIAAQSEPPEAAQAEAHYRQALTLVEELGMRPLQAHCHLGLGTLYVKTGQREQARTELSMAIDLYRDMDMIFWLPQAEAALAQAGS
jgi:tetratricopeptide (TPR) repeat protein